MPQKLINVKEAADLLGISRIKIRQLVERGELPAYKIGGKFIRFRKEQVEAIRNEVLRRVENNHLFQAQVHQAPREYPRHVQDIAYSQSFAERAADFFYFNDFYIVAAIATFLLLFFIFS